MDADTLNRPSTPAERRRAPRRQPAVGTVCRLENGGGVGLVWNISAGGVSMLLHEQPKPGTTLKGELMTTDQTHTVPISMRITHVARLRTGDYIIGGPFGRPLAPEEMRPFVAEV